MCRMYLLILLVGVCRSAPHHERAYPLSIPLPVPIRQPSVLCTTEYTTVWDTEYKETETQVCTTEYDKQCVTEYHALCLDTIRTECRTVYQNKCETVYHSVCVDKYKTEYEPFIESECTTLYKQDCEYRWEGEGNSKVWAPVPGTCKENPYDECKDVAKTKERQVAYPVCREVPQEKCVDVPTEACQDIPEQKCVDQPYETCQDIPRESCHNEHKKVPIRVSRKIPKQVCIHADEYPRGPVQAVLSVPAFFPVGAPVPAVPSPILPTPAPAIAVLPNAVVRTPKAAKDREALEDSKEFVGTSAKLVDGQEGKTEKPKLKAKKNDAVVFKE